MPRTRSSGVAPEPIVPPPKRPRKARADQNATTSSTTTTTTTSTTTSADITSLKEQLGALTSVTQSIQQSLASIMTPPASTQNPPRAPGTTASGLPTLPPTGIDTPTRTPAETIAATILGIPFPTGLPPYGPPPNASTTTPAADSLNQTVTDLLTSSIAPSTFRAYRQAWQLFRQFTLEIHGQDLTTLPVPPDLVSQFVAYMHNKGYAASSIPPKLSAVAFVHKLLNFPDPTQSFIIQKLVRASRKSQTPDGRRPITPPILKALLDAIPSVTSHAYDRQLFKALFLFSYHSLSRIGEVTVTGAANHTLQLSDINSQATPPHSILVTFRTYKHGNPSRPATISISPNTGSSYCPVASLKSYLTIRGNRAGCLFLRSDGRPVSSDLFSHTLRKCVKHVELDPREFTAHSFRIGAATHAALSGVPDKQLRALGRWSSDAFRSYIRP